MSLSSHKESKVWQKSVEFVSFVYKITDKFPQSQLYGLSSQMQRAAVSIPSNIAEGYTRKYRKEYIQFLRHALASASELETQLIIAKNLGFVNKNIFKRLEDELIEIMKMLNKLISVLSNK